MNQLDDSEIKDIFMNFNHARLGDAFDDASLYGVDEFLVRIFKSKEWKDASRFNERNEFIQKISNVKPSSDEHRVLFRALCEAGNSHGVAAYLHMLKRKQNVFLDDLSALITANDMAIIVKSCGSDIGSVIHFMARATTAGHSGASADLWRSITKSFDPSVKFKERFQEAMKTCVSRWGVKSIGLSTDDKETSRWIKQFFYSHDPKTQGISAAILAGQVSRKNITLEEIASHAKDLSGRVRVIKSFEVSDSTFEIVSIKSSKHETKPSYRL